MRTFAAIVASLLVACTNATEHSRSDGTAPSAQCDALTGAAELISSRDERFLIFGEVHGAQEPPRAFGEIVCEAAKRGPVLVGIERPPPMSPVIQAFIDSDGGAEAEAALISTYFDGSQWGLSSEAFLHLFRRLRELRASGATIHVVAFQEGPETAGGDQTPYEQSLARHLIHAAQQHPDARVLVLVGNLHARRSQWSSWQPMAMHLPLDDVLTFDLGYGSGEVFNCIQSGCGSNAVAGNDNGAPRLEFNGARPPYDGVWVVGPLSPAPPLGARP